MSIIYDEERELNVHQSVVWIKTKVPITIASMSGVESTLNMEVKHMSTPLANKGAVDSWIASALVDIGADYPHGQIVSIHVTKRM